VRRVIGYGIAALFLGWVAGLASAASVLGPGNDGVSGRAAASDGAPAASAAAAVPGAVTLSHQQFAALQDELQGLRREVKDLSGTVARGQHEVAAKLAALGHAPMPETTAAIPAAHPPTAAAAPAASSPATAAAKPPAAAAPPAGPSHGPQITASIPAPTAAPALPEPAPPHLQRAAASAHPAAARGLPPGLRGADSSDMPRRVLGRYALRGVDHGRAVVEGPGGAFAEVGVGDYVPGAGRVSAIARHGRAWVVVTQRGLIVSSLD
jgi:hypothetical protein